MLLLVATPTRVPTVSNMSIIRKVKTMTQNLRLKIPSSSRAKKVGAIDGGKLTIRSGKVTRPAGIAITVVTAIPIRMAPLTR